MITTKAPKKDTNRNAETNKYTANKELNRNRQNRDNKKKNGEKNKEINGRNKIFIGFWNVRIMLQVTKIEQILEEIKKL